MLGVLWASIRIVARGVLGNFNGQCIIRSSAMLAAFALALFSTPSLAIIFECELEGSTTFAPAHPQARDLLTFDTDLFNALPPPTWYGFTCRRQTSKSAARAPGAGA